jgi:hypothetical protein
MNVQMRLNAILTLPPGFFQPFSLFGGRRPERRRRIALRRRLAAGTVANVFGAMLGAAGQADLADCSGGWQAAVFAPLTHARSWE